MKFNYPSLRRFHEIDGFTISGNDGISEALSDGTCDIFILSKHTWEFTEARWAQCETMWLGVSKSLAAPLSYWLGNVLEAGALGKAFEEYTPIPRCAEHKNNNNVNSSVEPIGIESMTAPLLILGAGICFGMIYKGVKSSRQHIKNEAEIVIEDSLCIYYDSTKLN